MNTLILAEVLRADGYLVSEARDGAELIEMLGRGSVSPDVIVTDVKMPRLSGLEVLEALNRVHRDVPVVLMTAFSDGSVSAMAGKLCAVGVLHKPFDSDDLLTAVYNARKVVDARRARASSPMPFNHEVEATAPDDVHRLDDERDPRHDDDALPSYSGSP